MTMTGGAYRDLVEHVFEQGANDVRGVVQHRDDQFEVLCKREDVDGPTFQRRIEVTTKQAITKYRSSLEECTVVDPTTHIELFDGVAVIHLRETPGAGVLVSLDVAGMRELSSFAEDCHQYLDTAQTLAAPATADD